MITRKIIQDSLLRCQEELTLLDRKHSKLHQIDMLSGEGSSLREQINQTKGYIKALQWVLKML